MNNQNLKHPKIIAPPPRLYIYTFLLGLTLNYIYPISITHQITLEKIIASLLMICSVTIVSWAFVTMRSAKTSPNPHQTSAALVTHGPFNFSRNPIYVAMTGFYIGLALMLNSLWILFLLVPLLGLMQWGVIHREEMYLTNEFGERYNEYKKKVRAWL